jgi:hypothetical protein
MFFNLSMVSPKFLHAYLQRIVPVILSKELSSRAPEGGVAISDINIK